METRPNKQQIVITTECATRMRQEIHPNRFLPEVITKSEGSVSRRDGYQKNSYINAVVQPKKLDFLMQSDFIDASP